ncbi:MAG: RIP metalloprotease RseP [Candidatus Marinimicrobia bacterium]|nr:RIP metalloprotease RseP [Candidatus Neomarinimicrobiota bacterium]
MTMIWATILVIGVLVFVHELGHYLAARSVGVRVEKFSVGFPPRIISFTSIPGGWNVQLFFYKIIENKWIWSSIWSTSISRPKKAGTGTEYCLALIPIGGYVKMAGVIDESLDTTIEHKPDELMSKPNWAQIWVMSAGVIMNVLLAIGIFTGIAYHSGRPEIKDIPVVSQVIEDMPAAEIGLQEGDIITTIDGKAISTWMEMSAIIHTIPKQEIDLTWERNNKPMSAKVTTSWQLSLVDGKVDTLGAIGIYPSIEYVDVGLGEALKMGSISTIGSVALIGSSMSMLFSGEASIKELGGPIAIAQIAGETAKAGIIPLLAFMAFFSVNLAFINILPIPGLDGGHILIILIQSIIRRPLSIKVRLVIQQVGMALLLMLFVTVIYNDFARLFTG